MSLQNHSAKKLFLSFVFVCIVIFISAGVSQATYPGDLNTDGTVDWNDLAIMTSSWLVDNCGSIPQGNLDSDCDVDCNDYAILAKDWLQIYNFAPTVSAGLEQAITLPANATLDGTITDDGLPNPPGAVTTLWTKQSGPGTVIFGNANAIDTVASFSTDGIYVLRLTADDNELSNYDEVTITVNPYGVMPDYIKMVVHFHTTNSDGAQTLEQMMLKYRDDPCQPRDAACVTDHDYISNGTTYSTSTFLGINGVEASTGPHCVGLGVNGSGSVNWGATLQEEINNIRANGGLPIVAHPYWTYDYAGDPNILADMNDMTDCNIMAVYNHYCQAIWNNGNSEAYWDTLLSSGKRIWGVAEEDTHGWGNKCGFAVTMVDANDFSLDAIKDALSNGKMYFYVSANRWVPCMELVSYTVSGTIPGSTISVEVGGALVAPVTIQFIGNNGTVLQTVTGTTGSYTITGTENYVRTKIKDSSVSTEGVNWPSTTIWTQPVFVESSSPPPAEYEGYEPLATGGQGGTTVHVTNLADSGTGSLRDVIAGLSGSPTIIVFDVAGVICPASEIRITKSNVTIDGSSAPSPGITVAGAPGTMFGIDVDGDANIIIKHVRFRNAGLEDLQLWDGNKITIDHCSFSGSGDGALDINQGSNLLVSRCLFGGCVEVHKAHGTYVSVHHNLYSWNDRRQPRVFGGGPYWDFRNNVIEYWTNSGTNILQSDAVNIVNNWYGDPSPDSTCNMGFWSINDANYVYTNGNYSNCGQNIDAFGNTPTPNTEPSVTTLTASQVPANVLADVGAQPNDAIDLYYINGGGTTPPAIASCGGSSSGGGGGSGTYFSPDIKDGYVVESSETSGVGGASNQNSTYLGDSASNQQYIGVLHFDTSVIPDSATVTAATLTIRRFDVVGTPTSLGSITVDIKNGYYGTDDVLRAHDFESASSATNVATISYPASDGAYSSGDLNATGRAQINKTGITQFKVRFTTDDDNDSTADYLYLYDSSDPPSLAVTWE